MLEGASVRALILTDKAIHALDQARADDQPTPRYRIVPPRCRQCRHTLDRCPGHGNARLPGGVR